MLWSRSDKGIRTFWKSWGNPEQALDVEDQSLRQERYRRLWDLYTGIAFEDRAAWSNYMRANGLYRQTRQIFDHVFPLVEFYVAHVWPGTLAGDGLTLPDGVPNAIPLGKDTDRQLAAAIGQLWTWWNWQQNKDILVRYTAAVGEMLVELIDDTEKGKITANLVWPGFVRQIELDESGNVKAYVIEYEAWDSEREEFFRYRREVDKASFRTYRNDAPYDYRAFARPDESRDRLPTFDRADGMAADHAEIENPYGFVPACWFRHIPTLGVRGEPACWSTLSQLDELNSLLSHLLDKAHVNLEAPVIVSGNVTAGTLKRAFQSIYGSVKRTFTDELEDDRADRETLNVLQGPQGTSVSTIDLRMTDALAVVERIARAIEQKVPEVTLYERLRSMSQLTGPSVIPLLSDVANKASTIASGYDRQLVKLMQMGVAMAGWRANEAMGGWRSLTNAQRKFLPFNLDSFARGDLDVDIVPREIIPISAIDRARLVIAQKTVLPSMPETKVGELLGFNVDDVAAWVAQAHAEQETSDSEPSPKQTSVSVDDLARIVFSRPPGAPPGGPQRGSSQQRPHRRDR